MTKDNLDKLLNAGVTDVNYLGLEDHPLYPVAGKYLWLVDSEHDERYGKKVNRCDRGE